MTLCSQIRPYTNVRAAPCEDLGDVPDHWEIASLGQLGRFSKGNGGSKDDEVTAGIPCVRYGDLYTEHGNRITRTRSFIARERAIDYTAIHLGDVLFAASGETLEEIGKSAVNLISGEVRVGGDVLIFRAGRPVDPRFLGYACDAAPAVTQKARMGKGVTVMHIYVGALRHLRIAVPPVGEQAAIARFLDHADRRIQRYIRSKQRLIELLGEEKQAIIHRAVTRGLDPNVELKPSGVAWVGDTPSTWEVRPLGTLLRERGETNRGGEVDDVLSLTRDRGVIPYAEKGNIGNKKSDDITRYKVVRPQDIVMNSMNVIIGSVGISVYTGCLSPVYYVLMPRSDQVFVPFVGAFFQTKAFQRSLTRIGNGILAHRMRIPMEALKREPIPLPPIDEQRLITDYLSTEENRLGVLLTIARKQVHLITEYHTRLISDVVTGKLDVREAATALPDDPDADDSALDAALEEAVA